MKNHRASIGRPPRSPDSVGAVLPHSSYFDGRIREARSSSQKQIQSLVIAAGVVSEWLDDGGEVVVRDLPTRYGRLSYRLYREEPATWRVILHGAPLAPPGGVIVLPPLDNILVHIEHRLEGMHG